MCFQIFMCVFQVFFVILKPVFLSAVYMHYKTLQFVNYYRGYYHFLQAAVNGTVSAFRAGTITCLRYRPPELA